MSDENKSLISTPGFWVVTGIIVIAALFRFLPNPPNFAPVAAIALFGGTYFANKRFALLIPVGIMLFSDLFLGFHSTMWAVYLSFLLIVGIGYFLRGRVSFLNVTAAAFSGSILFFVVTNFAVWLMGSGLYYPKSFEGLLMCYTAAIPFFHYTMLGDLFYSGVLFGGYAFVRSYFPALKLA